MARLGPRNQSEPSVDNPVMQSLYEEANAVQQQEEEFQGKQGLAPSILTSGEINQLDSEFNNSEYVTNYWDSVYNTYIEEHAKAVEAGNMDEVAALNEQYSSLANTKNYFDDTYACTFNGVCGEESDNFYENQNEAWTWDDLKYNEPLLESIRRTNGAHKPNGELKTEQELITEFVKDQQWLEWNMVNKGFEAAKYDGLTDQQKEDSALQYLSFQKLYGTAGKGGIPTAQNWKNISGALVTDFTNYIGFGGIYKALGGKQIVKALTKEGFENRMKAILKKKTVAKTSTAGAAYGGTYTGLDKLSDENILVQAGLQDEKDLGKVFKAAGLGAAVGGTLGFLLGGTVKVFNKAAENYIAKQNINNQEFINEIAREVTDEKSLKVFLKKIGWSRKEIKEELDVYRQAKAQQSISLPGAGKDYIVPTEARGTEQAKFGPSNKDEFKASGAKKTAEEVNAERVAARAAQVTDDTGPATEAIYYPGQTADEASTILKEVEQTYSSPARPNKVEKIGETKSTILKEKEAAKPSTVLREIDQTTPINPHEGIVLNDKAVKVLDEVQPSGRTLRETESSLNNSKVLQEKVDNTFSPEEQALVREGEDLIDEAFIDIESIDIPISFSKLGQRAYDWINNTMGKGATRMLYGSDAILVRSGQRPLGEAISAAQATTDINVARIANDLQTFVAKNADELGELNKLIQRAIPENQAQKDFLAMLNKKKMAQLKVARDTGVISKEEYARFKHDKGYVPRVWNTQKLITLQGAQEFSTFLNNLWGKDPVEVRNLIMNLTGEKKLTDEVIDSRFSPENIRAMFRRKADREMDVKRSTHLEFERKLRIKPEVERELDAFMAAPLDRWTKFFEDVIRRNEYAKRFGKNDERVKKAIKKMREDGFGRQAEDVQEVYFTAVGDPKYSETIRARMDNPRLQQAVAKVNAFQNLKLGLAAIPNATQAFVNGTVMLGKSGSLLTAPYKAMSAIVKSIAKTRRAMDVVHNAGVLGEIDLSRIATENMPHARIVEREFKGPLKYLNEPTAFLRATGFLGVEQMNRRAAAIMAHGHVGSLHAKLQRLIMQGKANGKQSQRLQREMKQLGVMDPLKGELTARDYAISGHMFNKHVNFSGESFNLPVSWQKPWFKLMTKFKSFMFYQARFLKRQVADELFINKNPKPLIAYLAAAGIAGNQAELARALVSGKEIEENRTALELLISGIGNAGGAGLWFDTMQQVATRGPGGAWSAITGPTFSDIAYTAEDLANADIVSIIERMLPNLPGKGMVFNEWRDQ